MVLSGDKICLQKWTQFVDLTIFRMVKRYFNTLLHWIQVTSGRNAMYTLISTKVEFLKQNPKDLSFLMSVTKD